MNESQFLTSDFEQDSEKQQFLRELSQSYQRIYRCIRTWLPDRNDADDAMQETCLFLWKKFDQFTPGTDFTRWACTCAFKIARRVHERRRQSQKFQGIVFDDELMSDLRRAQEGNFEYLELRREQLHRCVSSLNTSDLGLLYAHYGDELSIPQIANERRQSERSVFRHLKRIRMALYRCVNRSLRLEDRND